LRWISALWKHAKDDDVFHVRSDAEEHSERIPSQERAVNGPVHDREPVWHCLYHLEHRFNLVEERVTVTDELVGDPAQPRSRPAPAGAG
jgi:hypothetical protein